MYFRKTCTRRKVAKIICERDPISKGDDLVDVCASTADVQVFGQTTQCIAAWSP